MMHQCIICVTRISNTIFGGHVSATHGSPMSGKQIILKPSQTASDRLLWSDEDHSTTSFRYHNRYVVHNHVVHTFITVHVVRYSIVWTALDVRFEHRQRYVKEQPLQNRLKQWNPLSCAYHCFVQSYHSSSPT